MAKVHPLTRNGIINLYVFFCPGCKYDHAFSIRQYREGGNPQWTFNNDVDRPTFTPSLLCNKDDPTCRCHSFVTDGKIQFLEDCFHGLAGQTVELPEYES